MRDFMLLIRNLKLLGALAMPAAATAGVLLTFGGGAPMNVPDAGADDSGTLDAGGSDGSTFDSGMPDSGLPLPDSGCMTNTQVLCAEAGAPGCAGAGGTGGTGGHGGGAAIALFVSGASSVTVENGGFFTGIGGNGGIGGAGGIGGTGSPGNNGSSLTCAATCTNSCTLSGTNTYSGGSGGGATNGAGGGVGGGGAGGSTYYYAVYGDAGVTVSAATLGASKHEGFPGPGGAPNGLDGGDGVVVTAP